MVIIGFLGTVLDGSSQTHRRWEKWRPTISLCQHEDVLVDRLELLINSKSRALAHLVKSDIKHVSPETEVIIHELELDDPWDFEQVYGALLDFAKSYPFDLDNEDYYMHITTGTHVAQICMFLLTEARYFPAKLLQTSPPKRSSHDPGTLSIIDLDLSKYDKIAERFAKEQQQALTSLQSGFITEHPELNQSIQELERVISKCNAGILLLGESGVGKSQLARQIYALKKQRYQLTGPFIEVNCASLSNPAELLGYKKSAIPGAHMDYAGVFHAAKNGVLYFDEIAATNDATQRVLLKILEQQSYCRLGDAQSRPVDFQIIAASQMNLAELVAKNAFRADLYAKLRQWTYQIPKLSARRQDIPNQIEIELQKFNQTLAQNVNFNKEAKQKYHAFCVSPEAKWQANFRDLSTSIQRMATLAENARIRVSDVDQEIERLSNSWKFSVTEHSLLHSVLPQEAINQIDLFDRIQLNEVIRICKEEQTLSAAGRRLFSASRIKKKQANDADRLSKYLQKFGLSIEDVL